MTKKTPPLEIKFYETKEFKEQQTYWYRKLKKEGFQDKEKVIGQKSELTTRADHRLWRYYPNLEERGEYYRAITHCLYDEAFESELDRIILSRVAEGKKIKEIANELKELGQACHRQTIRFRIRKYENKFGIRSWDEQKLNPPWKNGRKKAAIP